MNRPHYLRSIAGLVGALALGACASTQPEPTAYSGPATQSEREAAQAASFQPQTATLKRKIAIGRFSNETRYGRSLLTDQTVNPLGAQASDILSNRLVETGRFMVFERPDLDVVEAEQKLSGGTGQLVGVDAIILGAVTEFGRSNEGRQGFLSSTRRQVARAAVEIRLVDARTGYVFFTATGRGEASVEAGRVAGFGNRVGYDATLNDRAIAAAIADLQTPLMNQLEERPWRTDVLSVRGNRILISGGKAQGLEVGDELIVMRKGETMTSAQTGFPIELPGTEVARVRVESFFGSDETNEGSVAAIVSGGRLNGELDAFFVKDAEQGS